MLESFFLSFFTRSSQLADLDSKTPPSDEEVRELLVRWVVCSDQAFAAVDHADFRAFINRIAPGVAIPSRYTVKRDIMKRFHEQERRVGERLRNAAGKISVTLDCWTSPNNKAFLGITGHYIDDGWAMQSLVLDFVPLSDEHTGENLCGAFVGACERLGILDKLLGVTTDNASNIGKLLECLEDACSDRSIPFSKEQQHMRCVSHVMNLAVQAFLRELKAEDSNADSGLDRGAATQTGSESCIDKLRRLVRWIRSSPQRSGWFKNLCDSCGIPSKEVILDSCTRWNSTYAMIQRACEFQMPLSRAKEMSPELNSEEWMLLKVTSQVLSTFFLQPFIPFDAAVTVTQVLSIFEKATRWLCATNYPTLNRAVRVYNCLIDELEYFLGRCNDEEEGRQRAAIVNRCSPTAKRALTAAMEAAHAKLLDYYSTTWAGMYAVALILDPASKMEYYEDSDWEAGDIAGAKNALVKVIEEYGEASTVPQPSQASSVADFCEADPDELWKKKKKRRRLEKESELERYLKASTVDTCAGILEWWKQNAGSYPRLARIARDYLVIPATSAPAERVFSCGADLIATKRGSLSEDTIRVCMCLDSWMRLSSS